MLFGAATPSSSMNLGETDAKRHLVPQCQHRHRVVGAAGWTHPNGVGLPRPSDTRGVDSGAVFSFHAASGFCHRPVI